jgi:penicillin-binding protein 1A
MKNGSKKTKPDGSDYDITKMVEKIYTTIDSRMQLYAEEAVTAHIANLQEEFSFNKPIKTHHS